MGIYTDNKVYGIKWGHFESDLVELDPDEIEERLIHNNNDNDNEINCDNDDIHKTFIADYEIIQDAPIREKNKIKSMYTIFCGEFIPYKCKIYVYQNYSSTYGPGPETETFFMWRAINTNQFEAWLLD